MYPLKFDPILKQTLWGGNKIIPFKNIDDQLSRVGESWEISAVEGNESVIRNGVYKGRTLTELIREFKEEIVGEENYQLYGEKFPLLIKFIDASLDLSIQVHPNDELAQKRHNSRGKNEMWFVVDAKVGAKLISGFSKQISQKEYKELVKAGKFEQVLQHYDVKPGDVFYVPAGRVHGIGAGTFLAEIQQTSDVTYRIYDYNRRDENGNMRELHTTLAMDAIDFEDYGENNRTEYELVENEPVELLATPYFITSLYDVNEELSCDYSELDSFVVYICVDGSCSLKDDENNEICLSKGETLLLSATTQNVTIIPNGRVRLLETYV